MNTIQITSINDEHKAALLGKWVDIALPYEEELVDCFYTIIEQRKLTGDEVLNGDGVLVKHTRGGYIIRTDADEHFFLPRECYKGVNDKCGTRIIVRRIKDADKGKICAAALECVCFSEFQKRMISSIRIGDMGTATVVAWGIYKDAPEPLMHKMKRIIKSLRSLHKRFVTFIETPVLENPARLSEV